MHIVDKTYTSPCIQPAKGPSARGCSPSILLIARLLIPVGGAGR